MKTVTRTYNNVQMRQKKNDYNMYRPLTTNNSIKSHRSSSNNNISNDNITHTHHDNPSHMVGNANGDTRYRYEREDKRRNSIDVGGYDLFETKRPKIGLKLSVKKGSAQRKVVDIMNPLIEEKKNKDQPNIASPGSFVSEAVDEVRKITRCFKKCKIAAFNSKLNGYDQLSSFTTSLFPLIYGKGLVLIAVSTRLAGNEWEVECEYKLNKRLCKMFIILANDHISSILHTVRCINISGRKDIEVDNTEYSIVTVMRDTIKMQFVVNEDHNNPLIHL